MKKIVLLLVVTAVALMAKEVDGYEVYKKNCKMCHIEQITKKETMKIFKTLKAPPMIEVSHQLQRNIIIKDDDDDVKRFVVISFIKEYLKKPSLDYSMCEAGAIDNFGIMPSQKHLSDAEREAVANWILDFYEDKVF